MSHCVVILETELVSLLNSTISRALAHVTENKRFVIIKRNASILYKKKKKKKMMCLGFAEAF